MRAMKKLSALILAIVMMLAMTMTALAAPQEVGTQKDNTASITIQNAAIGQSYTVVKLFDAELDPTQTDGPIVYKGTIPDDLKDYFKEELGTIREIKDTSRKENGEMSDGLKDALKTWAVGEKKEGTVATSSTLIFRGLPYGYYVVLSDQGTAITVDSTNPNAVIYDKNETKPSVAVDAKKIVGDDDVYIGETVTYTIEFKTSNYDGKDEAAKQITEYYVCDTLPEYLSNPTVTSVVISQKDLEDVTLTGNAVQFAEKGEFGKCITLPWAESGDSKYKNGATVKVTYTAVVNEKIKVIDEDLNGNKNTFTLRYKAGDEVKKVPETSTKEIFTYAIAVKKIDEKGNPLPGAKFKIAGVQAKSIGNGIYQVTGKNAEEEATTMDVSTADGILLIKGIDPAAYEIEEAEAPTGYNKLVDKVSVLETDFVKERRTVTTTVKDGETTKEIKYSGPENLTAKPLIVMNEKGSTLPSTGGIGTTIFYVVGGVLVAAAVILLVTKKRMSNRA